MGKDQHISLGRLYPVSTAFVRKVMPSLGLVLDAYGNEEFFTVLFQDLPREEMLGKSLTGK
jgi:hypothetical protein